MGVLSGGENTIHVGWQMEAHYSVSSHEWNQAVQPVVPLDASCDSTDANYTTETTGSRWNHPKSCLSGNPTQS